MPEFSRRDFLKAGGSLAVGFSLFSGALYAEQSRERTGQQEMPGGLSSHPRVDSWLKLREDGSVVVFTGKLELGQGVRIAVAQVAAEELNLDIERVEVVLADTALTPNERYTSGSRSTESSVMSVRYAAATAREQMADLAAERWGLSRDQVKVLEGSVHNRDGTRSLSFAKLLDGRQLETEVRLPVPLKPREHYRYVGKPVQRKDIAGMVEGRPTYVQDLRFDRMAHARLVRAPGYDSSLQGYDPEAALSVSGCFKVVRKQSFLAVLADTEWAAEKAARSLRQTCKFTSPRPLPQRPVDAAYLRSLENRAQEVLNRGDAGDFQPTHRATYFKPYIMHGSIGPSCAVALYQDSQLHIWSHSQGVFPLRDTLSALLGMPEQDIRITGVPGPGCYGHNGADDVAAEAAVLAREVPGRHVRLQWTRAEEHGWEPYGSAMLMELAARVDERGRIQNWSHKLWSDTHSTRPGGDPANLLAGRALRSHTTLGRGFLGGGYRNAEPGYDFPNLKVSAHFFEGPYRVSALRGLGGYANVFAIESFMDELAARVGSDPFTFRLLHLGDPRGRAVLEKLRERVAGVELARGEGLGVGYARYKNSASYCAVAAHVRVRRYPDEIQVFKTWGVVDAGEVIHPDGLANQIEGGMVQSVSWTLKERVRSDGDAISSLDWDSYPILRMPEIPETEVAILDRPEEPVLGAGETAQGPTSAAVANAIARACGQRPRNLPVQPLS